MNDVLVIKVLEALDQLRDDLLGNFLAQKTTGLPVNELFEVASVGELLDQIDPVLTAVRLILLGDVAVIDPTHQLTFSLDAVPATFGERVVTLNVEVILGYALDRVVTFHLIIDTMLCLHDSRCHSCVKYGVQFEGTTIAHLDNFSAKWGRLGL